MLQLHGRIMTEITVHFREVIFTYTYILEIRQISSILRTTGRHCTFQYCTVQTCNSNTKENSHGQPGLYNEFQDSLGCTVWPSKEQINNVLGNRRRIKKTRVGAGEMAHRQRRLPHRQLPAHCTAQEDWQPACSLSLACALPEARRLTTGGLGVTHSRCSLEKVKGGGARPWTQASGL